MWWCLPITPAPRIWGRRSQVWEKPGLHPEILSHPPPNKGNLSDLYFLCLYLRDVKPPQERKHSFSLLCMYVTLKYCLPVNWIDEWVVMCWFSQCVTLNGKCVPEYAIMSTVKIIIKKYFATVSIHGVGHGQLILVLNTSYGVLVFNLWGRGAVNYLLWLENGSFPLLCINNFHILKTFPHAFLFISCCYWNKWPQPRYR